MKHSHWLPLVRDYTLISAGVMLQALSMVLFYIPGNLAAGGVSGIAQLIGNFTGWPVGTLYIVLNVPLLALGWKYLGGRRFLTRTIFAVLGYSIMMDVLTVMLPKNGLTSDSILNALYGGVIGGVGCWSCADRELPAAPTFWCACLTFGAVFRTVRLTSPLMCLWCS
jgi:uncharacterized membrane-anchored protein YitT (DUF2179 family)